MKADLENLGKWIDELTSSIEDLKKRVSQINIRPVSDIVIEDLGSSTFSSETHGAAIYFAEGVHVDDYSLLIVSIFQEVSPTIWTTRTLDIHIPMTESGYISNIMFDGSEGSFSAFISRGTYGSPDAVFFEILTDPVGDNVQTLSVNMKGVKITEPETQQRSIVKKATEAVKKAVKRKTTKGGKKKDASK